MHACVCVYVCPGSHYFPYPSIRVCIHMYVYLYVLEVTHPLINLYAYVCKYMYPSIRVRMHMYVNLCLLVATHPLIHLYAYVCKYMYPSIRVCIHMYICMSWKSLIPLSIYTRMYANICIHLYAFVYTCISVCPGSHSSPYQSVRV